MSGYISIIVFTPHQFYSFNALKLPRRNYLNKYKLKSDQTSERIVDFIHTLTRYVVRYGTRFRKLEHSIINYSNYSFNNKLQPCKYIYSPVCLQYDETLFSCNDFKPLWWYCGWDDKVKICRNFKIFSILTTQILKHNFPHTHTFNT